MHSALSGPRGALVLLGGLLLAAAVSGWRAAQAAEAAPAAPAAPTALAAPAAEAAPEALLATG